MLRARAYTFQLNSFQECALDAHRRAYLSYITSSVWRLESCLNSARKQREWQLNSAGRKRKRKGEKRKDKKKQSVRIHARRYRGIPQCNSRERDEREARIRGNLYRGDDKISPLSFLLLLRVSLLSVSLPLSRVPFANDFPLLISSPSARRGAPVRSLVLSLALFLSSSDDKSETSHVHTETRAPKGGNKRFVAAARQEPP